MKPPYPPGSPEAEAIVDMWRDRYRAEALAAKARPRNRRIAATLHRNAAAKRAASGKATRPKRPPRPRSAGPTPAQQRVLDARQELEAEGTEASFTQIAERLGCSRENITNHVRRLKQRGLWI